MSGEIVTPGGGIPLNAVADAIRLAVGLSATRRRRWGTETSPALDLDREAARGRRLVVAAGTIADFDLA